MARFDKSSTKRPKQNAAVAAARGPKRSTAPSIEDTMFFPRLRHHAKWMFVFLALALGGGFVLFGVGAGGTGVGDIFRGGGNSSGVPSVSSAEKQTREHPNDIAAWRNLSTALQADDQTDRAITAEEKVVQLSPRDTDALRELAGLYIAQATAKQQAAQIIQYQAQYAGAGASMPGLLTDPTGQPLVADKISSTEAAQGDAAVQKLVIGAQTASGKAVGAYVKITRLQPKDPNVRLELAQAAQSAGDTATAIAAYTAFLKLAPDDANASVVRAQIKQLKQGSASSG